MLLRSSIDKGKKPSINAAVIVTGRQKWWEIRDNIGLKNQCKLNATATHMCTRCGKLITHKAL